MTLADWESKVLGRQGARERVDELTNGMLAAQLLYRARKKAKLSQREVAKRMGVSQPRVAAIERADDMSITTFLRYARAIGGTPHLEIELDGMRFALESTDILAAGG